MHLTATRRLAGPLLVVLLGVPALLVLAAAPAAADPAGPTDYQAQVTETVPESDAVTVEVVGGDSFLRLDVEPGHEVEVLGYEGEPYLRVLPDGTVQVNRRSPAAYLNDDRFGNVTVPADADPEAEPQWEDVADDGTFLWHDHRIHWMGGTLPPIVAGAGLPTEVQSWTVDLVVDGEPVEVRGDLVLHPSPSPLPWLALGLVAAAVVGVVAWRRPIVGTAVALLVAAVAATAVGWAQWSDVPASVRPTPLVVLVPLGAVAASVVALGLRRSPAGAVVALLASGLLIGWVALRWSVLTAQFLPTPLPAALDRAVVAATAGVAVASVVVVLASGAFRPVLPDDDVDVDVGPATT